MKKSKKKKLTRIKEIQLHQHQHIVEGTNIVSTFGAPHPEKSDHKNPKTQAHHLFTLSLIGV